MTEELKVPPPANDEEREAAIFLGMSLLVIMRKYTDQQKFLTAEASIEAVLEFTDPQGRLWKFKGTAE